MEKKYAFNKSLYYTEIERILIPGYISEEDILLVQEYSRKEEVIFVNLSVQGKALKFCEQLMDESKEVYLVEMEVGDPSKMGFKSFTHLIQHTEPLSYHSLMAKKLFPG